MTTVMAALPNIGVACKADIFHVWSMKTPKFKELPCCGKLFKVHKIGTLRYDMYMYLR